MLYLITMTKSNLWKFIVAYNSSQESIMAGKTRQPMTRTGGGRITSSIINMKQREVEQEAGGGSKPVKPTSTYVLPPARLSLPNFPHIVHEPRGTFVILATTPS